MSAHYLIQLKNDENKINRYIFRRWGPTLKEETRRGDEKQVPQNAADP